MHEVGGENGSIAGMAKTKDPFEGSEKFEAKRTRVDFFEDGLGFAVEELFDEKGDRKGDPII
jgi:hypothetical protein